MRKGSIVLATISLVALFVLSGCGTETVTTTEKTTETIIRTTTDTYTPPSVTVTSTITSTQTMTVTDTSTCTFIDNTTTQSTKEPEGIDIQVEYINNVDSACTLNKLASSFKPTGITISGQVNNIVSFTNINVAVEAGLYDINGTLVSTSSSLYFNLPPLNSRTFELAISVDNPSEVASCIITVDYH
jgi:hypothetical protein